MVIERLMQTLAFFRSVIRSGEPWTDECQKAWDGARRVVELGERPTKPAEDAPHRQEEEACSICKRHLVRYRITGFEGGVCWHCCFDASKPAEEVADEKASEAQGAHRAVASAQDEQGAEIEGPPVQADQGVTDEPAEDAPLATDQEGVWDGMSHERFNTLLNNTPTPEDRPACKTCGGGNYMISADVGRYHKKGCYGDEFNVPSRIKEA